jgi:hypothetical protein
VFLVFNVLVERFFEKTAFSDAAINNDGDCDMSLISLYEKYPFQVELLCAKPIEIVSNKRKI